MPQAASSLLTVPGIASTAIPVPVTAVPTVASKFADKHTVRIRNVISNLELKDLKPIFDAFGTIHSIDYVADPSGMPGTNTAYIVYQNTASADGAVQSMDKFNLAGLSLSIDILLPTTVAVGTTGTGAAFGTGTEPFKSVVLRNMVTLEDTTDPSLSEEIGEEAGKYGTLVNINIDATNPSDVLVLLKYSDGSEAIKATTAMNGRAFASRKIVASLLP